MKGKQTCEILKDIRRQIAEQNNIEFITSECTFQGDCKGTCPRCEAEVRYLERELEKRQRMGKAVALAVLSMGMIGGISGCGCVPKTASSGSAIEEPNSQTALAGNVAVGENSVKMDSTKLINVSEKAKEDTLLQSMFERPTAGIIAPQDEVNLQQYASTPHFPQGESAMLQFIAENLSFSSYLDQAKGKMKIKFVVENDGSLSHVAVVESLDKAFDQDVMRVFGLMQKWVPAKVLVDGREKPVALSVEIVLTFPLLYK
jgi:Gram-negative bacterial tonB protein.